MTKKNGGLTVGVRAELEMVCALIVCIALCFSQMVWLYLL